MIKLRTLLLSNFPFAFLLFFTLFFVGIQFFFFKPHTMISKEEQFLCGRIKDIKPMDEKVQIKLKVKKEYVLVSIKDNPYQLNDLVCVQGTLEEPKTSTMLNGFDYKRYLSYQKTFYLMNAETIKGKEKNKNIFYMIKSKIIEKIETYKSKAYLYLFLLGDKRKVDSSIYKTFQKNGISHLFCVSGMHVSLLTSVLLSFFKKAKIKEKKRYILLFLFLLFYLFLTDFSPSILRSALFFILISINEYYYLHIKTMHLFLVTFCICLLLNPYFLFHLGFLFSFTITFFLLLFSTYLHSNSKLKNLFMVSMISFLAGLPICLYAFYRINLLSILFNIFFVPFVSFLVFPLSLLTFVFPFLDAIFYFITGLMENLSIFLSHIDTFTFSFMKPNVIIVFFYYFILILCIYFFFHHKKWCFLFLFLILSCHYYYPLFQREDYLLMIDVGQGDSFLIHTQNKNILIDTGGNLFSKTSSLAENLITMFSSLGIHKIDYLFLTHGDYDHAGETLYLIENYKIDRIYLNQGNFNTLEKQIIKKHRKTNQIEEGQVLKIGVITFVQLNKEWEDENDSSSVLLMYYQNRKILFTGDASQTTEKYILDTYDLENIDILKVGHHGSRTSTSEELLQATTPKLALISCGEDNKFKHPHQETITKLNKYHIKYFTTVQEGTIKINLHTLKII